MTPSVILPSLAATLAFLPYTMGLVLGIENRCSFGVQIDSNQPAFGYIEAGLYLEAEISGIDARLYHRSFREHQFRLILQPSGNNAQYQLISNGPTLYDGGRAHEVALFPDPEERPDCPIGHCDFADGCTGLTETCTNGLDEYYNLVLCVE